MHSWPRFCMIFCGAALPIRAAASPIMVRRSNAMKRLFRQKLMIALIAPMTTLPVAMSSFAANDNKTVNNRQESNAQRASREMRASELIGKEVRNTQGENLGEIKDLIVDVNNSRIHYAVLSFGGFLG